MSVAAIYIIKRYKNNSVHLRVPALLLVYLHYLYLNEMHYKPSSEESGRVASYH
jgi:hypothetical protein